MSPLIHALIALGFYLPFAAYGNPVVGAAAGAFYYLGREGLDAQIATGKSKNETKLLPFTPWKWPRQSILDSVVPAAVVVAVAWGWIAFNEWAVKAILGGRF